MLLYLAGPDVFRPNAKQWAESARTLCRQYGYEALIPTDSNEERPDKIYAANVAMIRRAQIIVANLDSFRGAEPDSGTCFELGYAAALGKRLCGYVTDALTVVERVAHFERRNADGGELGRLDKQGWHIEDFGLPANLMLAISTPISAGGLESCLQFLKRTQPVLATT